MRNRGTKRNEESRFIGRLKAQSPQCEFKNLLGGVGQEIVPDTIVATPFGILTIEFKWWGVVKNTTFTMNYKWKHALQRDVVARLDFFSRVMIGEKMFHYSWLAGGFLDEQGTERIAMIWGTHPWIGDPPTREQFLAARWPETAGKPLPMLVAECMHICERGIK